jgi:signal transduction histidine kinase
MRRIELVCGDRTEQGILNSKRKSLPEETMSSSGPHSGSPPPTPGLSGLDEYRVLELLSSLSYRNGALEEYLQAIAIGVSQLLLIDYSIVTFCEQGVDTVLSSSLPSDPDLGQTFSLHGTITNTVFQTGRALVVEDTDAHPEYGELPEGYYAYLGVPLRTAHGEVIGTICSFHERKRCFSPEDVRVAEIFAERAATAIDNYQLYRQQIEFNQVLEAEVIKRTRELRASQSKLIEKERLAAIGEFAATIVHEIRNPLTTVMMSLQSLQRQRLSPDTQTRLTLGLEEAERLKKLLSEILQLAKPQSLQLETLELNQWLQDLLPTLSEMPAAQSRQLQFVPGSEPVTVAADRDKLKQVMINLVRNACEAVMEGDTVHCRLVLIPGQEGAGQWVRLEIQNPGAVIPPEVLAKFGRPFYSTKSAGTGLGLAIVKRIVDAHGGAFRIDSYPQVGTTVGVELLRSQLLPHHPLSTKGA